MREEVGRLIASVGTVIKGKDEVIANAVITLLARGHLLIEDVPGVGKTALAFALAKSIDCGFHRIQFTSDLLPSDIIGVSIYNPEARQFEFRRGPLFSNIVLADEINRTSPKTQSALLEAMSERRVSVDPGTLRLPEPFMVIATQNPVEYHGTFPLPESQMDRFMLHLRIGYPDPESEKLAVLDPRGFDRIESITPVLGGGDVIRMQEEAATVKADAGIMDYLLAIIGATRRDDRIRLGASTRGSQFLFRAAQARAFVLGRAFVIPEDVKELAPMVLGHRLILRERARLPEADGVVREIVSSIPVPL